MSSQPQKARDAALGEGPHFKKAWRNRQKEKETNIFLMTNSTNIL